MNKKKITTIALAVIVAAIAISGATMAYFSDKEEKTNVFTTGKVDISLEENFDENSAKLLPGSETVNFVTKEVSIKAEDNSEDAYVWYEYLIPEELDNADADDDIVIHVVGAGNTNAATREDSNLWAEDQTEALPVEQTWDYTFNGTNRGFIGTEEISGITYNKYVVLYNGVLAAGEETTVAMSKVYMDAAVDTNTSGEYTLDGNVINYDFADGLNIIVRAYGIQADGFEDVYAAYNAYNA